jgi:hypothetical protein
MIRETDLPKIAVITPDGLVPSEDYQQPRGWRSALTTIRTLSEIILVRFGNRRLREKYERLSLLAAGIQITELHRKGLSASVIAAQLGMRPELVLKMLNDRVMNEPRS